MFEWDKLSFLIAVLLYGASAVHTIFLWRKGFTRHNHVTYLLVLGGFCFHTAAMALRGFSLQRCPIRNLYEATLFLEWSIVAGYLLLGLWGRMKFLGAFASPLLLAIGVFALMPGLDVQSETGRFQYGNGWVSLHAALFALAYGALGISAVAGMMYLIQERDLKQRRLRAVLSLMPSLQRLELVTSRVLLVGLVLLTAALGMSGLLARHAREIDASVKLAGDPKILWSLLVWAIYLALALMRWRSVQGSRRFVWGVVGGFVFVLLTFWGTNLLSPLHHQP